MRVQGWLGNQLKKASESVESWPDWMKENQAVKWFLNHRLEWIAETLRVFGYINRAHLMRKFGISEPQASADLREFQRINPGAVKYDKSEKRYVARGK